MSALQTLGASTPGIHALEFRGLPCVQLQLAAGDRVTVARHGAHVVSWTSADGIERLYLSPKALLDGRSAIRGGVPICFPQFNERVLGACPLPKHGFARTSRWAVQSQVEQPETLELSLCLKSDASTVAQWPHAFVLSFTVRLTPGSLRMAFSVRNNGAHAFPCALALHTYLAVQDIAQVRLEGLQGHSFWDGVADLQDQTKRRIEDRPAVVFAGETDRVYQDVHQPLMLHDGQRSLRLQQSSTLSDVVVWNPAAAKCASMADMAPDSWKTMVCVEAARINQPIEIPPQSDWHAWQELAVVS